MIESHNKEDFPSALNFGLLQALHREEMNIEQWLTLRSFHAVSSMFDKKDNFVDWKTCIGLVKHWQEDALQFLAAT